MPSVVAIVEARPETIAGDYRRVMELAGLLPVPNNSIPGLLPQWSGSSFQPGYHSPVWQLSCTLAAFADAPADAPETRVFPVGLQGPDLGCALAAKAGMPAILSQNRGQIPAAELGQMKPIRVHTPLPALGAVSPQGFQAPPLLAGEPTLLLPVPELNASWQLAGSVALLSRLFAGRVRQVKQIPRSEIIAETVALAQGYLGPIGVVLDGVVWGVHGQDGKSHALIRNVVLAGNDPVAVDAVAARLAGLEPRKIPWLQLCQDRGLGNVDTTKIQIKGRKDLLALDFQFPEGTFATGGAVGSVLSWPGRVLGALGRKNTGKEFATSGWGRMISEFEAGVTT